MCFLTSCWTKMIENRRGREVVMSRKPPSVSPSAEKLHSIKVLQRVLRAKKMTDEYSSDLLMETICLKQSLLLIYM